ncbi:hypothetical protein BHM03_00056195, partial [Ensete ventricosum]
MAWLPARGGLRGQAPYKGWSPAGTAGCGQPARASRQQPTRKGLPLVAIPSASRGGGAGRKGGRPLVGRLPAAKGNRHLRRGNGDDDA